MGKASLKKKKGKKKKTKLSSFASPSECVTDRENPSSFSFSEDTGEGGKQRMLKASLNKKKRKKIAKMSSASSLLPSECATDEDYCLSSSFSEDAAEDEKQIKLKASSKKKKGKKKKKSKLYFPASTTAPSEDDTDEQYPGIKLDLCESKRKAELARPLTNRQIKAILGDEDRNSVSISSTSHWVRRSVRQPSRHVLKSPQVKNLLKRLRSNHEDMVVLKMKKYISDPAAPSIVIDVALEALEKNTNCEALYIQNFNTAVKDKQVIHLLRILQLPTCKIWCLNIGETYNVTDETWEMFAEGLTKTKITHMYASEHTITAALKEQIRATIRENRKKHHLHDDPENLDTIVQCTHCWWNPMNSKALRPYLMKRGFEYILYDKEVQGLRGSMSSAPSF